MLQNFKDFYQALDPVEKVAVCIIAAGAVLLFLSVFLKGV